jgi:hypothetical protein
MTTILKTDAVTEALKEIVAGKEDFVYPYHETQCFYTDPEDRTAPSCIVGHVIDAIDHEALERLGEYEMQDGESFSVAEMNNGKRFNQRFDLDFDSATLQEALQAAQEVQDLGIPWGRSWEAYQRVLAGENRRTVVDGIRDEFGR